MRKTIICGLIGLPIILCQLAPKILYAQLVPSGKWQNVNPSVDVPTFSAGDTNFSSSFAGDLFCISGAAAPTVVQIKGIRIAALASAALNANITIVRRSSLNIGGTATVVTPTASDPIDQGNQLATVKEYSTASTQGTLVGNIVRGQLYTIATVTTPQSSQTPILFQFTPYWDKPQVLRSATQELCAVVPSTAGGQWTWDIEWTEQKLGGP